MKRPISCDFSDRARHAINVADIRPNGGALFQGAAQQGHPSRCLPQRARGLHLGTASNHPLAQSSGIGKGGVKTAKVKATNFKACLALEVPAYVAIYRSAPNFSGADILSIEVSYPGGRTNPKDHRQCERDRGAAEDLSSRAAR